MPRVIAADWSHELIGRDYLVQTLLDGVPAPERLPGYPRPAWTSYFRRLGEITRTVHGVRGPRFGPVGAPAYDTWSQAVAGSLNEIAADVEAAGLDGADLRAAADLAVERHAVLDEVTEPRLLTGDLWTVNVMLAADAPSPPSPACSTSTAPGGAIPPPTGRSAWRRPGRTNGCRSGRRTASRTAPRGGLAVDDLRDPPPRRRPPGAPPARAGRPGA
ncbi:phosphotransferase [Nonomuraea antimicrobica]